MKKYQIIIGEFSSDPPKRHEINAAKILLNFFKADITFLRPSFGKTPDFLINAELWELKSPKGSSKNTIGNNIHQAKRQSKNIIIDLSRCNFTKEKAIQNIGEYIKKYPKNIKKIIVITKSKEVLTIYQI